MEQSTVAESDITTETPVEETPVTDTPPAQIEDEPASDEATETETPADEAAEEAALPEVEAHVTHDLYDGKYLVSVTTRHPDPTKVAVNGRLVWEG